MSDTVEAAKAPGVFSMDQFLADTAYPEDKVTVFTNAYAMGELVKRREQRAELEAKLAELDKAKPKRNGPRVISDTDAPDVNAQSKEIINKQLEVLQLEIEDWDAKVEASALTFSLRGMAPFVVEEITSKHFADPKKDYSGTPEEEARDDELVARSILTATNADGAVDSRVFTPEDVKLLRGRLIGGEYLRVVQTVAKVNLNAALFEQAADATFLGRRTNLAR